ncbi:MAG: M1 family metallopeptidase [Flavobacteriales bacterium]
MNLAGNLILIVVSVCAMAQPLQQKHSFSKQDSLRGSDNAFRNWWDVQHYNLFVKPDFDKKSIEGVNEIKFLVKNNKIPQKPMMQIDLQEPMELSKVLFKGKELDYTQEGNVYFIPIDYNLLKGEEQTITLYYKGNPKIAKRPPWDGGWIFKKDQKGRPWMSVACQGLGASVWYPNKDYLGDEPDKGVTFTVEVEGDMVAVGNGRLKEKKNNRYTWEVTQPINNYNIIPYIGYYVNFKDEFIGEKGHLDLDYWVLDYNLEKSEKQFQQVKPMMKIFENWLGPYPFYEDSYKLVEAPHLGMEHQSNVAYGNRYVNGYLGMDISGSGWGLKWDFIIIHESGHEWFGNNITNKDIADMWIHESFTSYSETLYVESMFGKEAANDYVIGTRKSIVNDIPIIGVYGVNQEGSGDMYYKGANMLHTLRQLLDDDALFRKVLRGMGKEFYHQTVTSKQIESYINKVTSKDFTTFFNQYLRTTKIPTLEYSIKGDMLTYRWVNIVKGFDMPVKLADSEKWIFPTSIWKKEKLPNQLKKLSIDRNFYIQLKESKQ